MTDETPLLEVENLRTSFETERGVVQAVDGISFEIHPGEVFGLVGESGSGKSVTSFSLLQLIESNGDIEADTIRYKGEDLLAVSDREMQSIRGGEISMIFQDPMNSLNPSMTVGEQIAEVYRHHQDSGESTNLGSEILRKYITGTDKSSPSWQYAVELLDTVGIPDPDQRATEYPHQLSGGMRQRVMIAQALAGDPSLLIADEPTTALDVSIEVQILNELLDLRDEFDLSILFITHDLGVIRETADRVAVMYAGELMEKAPTSKLFSAPQHPYTEGLLESIPRITDDQEWLNPIEGNVPDLINKSVGCPFRDRCDKEFELCDRPLVEYQPKENHSVQCHLYNKFVRADDEGYVEHVDESAAIALLEEKDRQKESSTHEAEAKGGVNR